MNQASIIEKSKLNLSQREPIQKILVKDFEGNESITNLLQKLQSKSDPQNILIDPGFYQKALEFVLDPELTANNECVPYLVLYLRGDEPVAGVVAYRYQRKQPLKFGYLSLSAPALRCLEVEIGGLLACEADDACQLIQDLGELLQTSSVDCINFKHVRQDSIFYTLLSKAPHLNRQAIFSPFNEWIIPMVDPETGQPINLKKTGKSGKRERALERKLINAFDGSIDIQNFLNAGHIQTFISEANSIAKSSYQYAAKIGIQDNSKWNKELDLLLEMGCFRGYILYGNGKPIAYNFGVVYGGRFTGYAMSFDPQYRHLSPGVYLLKKVKESLVAEGVDIFHFGYGDAEYKQRFATDCIPGSTIRVYGRHARPWLVYQLDRTSSSLMSKLKQTLQRLGLFNAMKKLWRSQLKRPANTTS